MKLHILITLGKKVKMSTLNHHLASWDLAWRSKCDISVSFSPNDFWVGAFESPWSIFYKNKKLFILPQSPFISEVIEEALKSQFWVGSVLNPSSVPSEIKGDWGRIKIFLFLKNIDHKLSNASFPVCFRQLFTENEDWTSNTNRP